MSDNGDVMGPFILVCFLLASSILINISWFTWNSDIQGGERFRIGDAVYSCELKQKLEYEK